MDLRTSESPPGPIAPEVIRRVRARLDALFLNFFPDNPLWTIPVGHVEAYDVFFTKERYALRSLQQAGLKAGEEVVAYRDLAELRRQLDFYLAHPDQARAIGANARRRALAEHTLRHRIEEMLAVVEERFGRRC